MRKGFTLLELLIVVVILGVLALIAAPTLLNAADKAKDGAVLANVSATASSVTSQFALGADKTAAEIATDVAAKLNETNTNPFDKTDAASFVTAEAKTAGKVNLLAGTDTDADGNTYDIITIYGYGKGNVELAKKVIAAPGNS